MSSGAMLITTLLYLLTPLLVKPLENDGVVYVLINFVALFLFLF